MKTVLNSFVASLCGYLRMLSAQSNTFAKISDRFKRPENCDIRLSWANRKQIQMYGPLRSWQLSRIFQGNGL